MKVDFKQQFHHKDYNNLPGGDRLLAVKVASLQEEWLARALKKLERRMELEIEEEDPEVDEEEQVGEAGVVEPDGGDEG